MPQDLQEFLDMFGLNNPDAGAIGGGAPTVGEDVIPNSRGIPSMLTDIPSSQLTNDYLKKIEALAASLAERQRKQPDPITEARRVQEELKQKTREDYLSENYGIKPGQKMGLGRGILATIGEVVKSATNRPNYTTAESKLPEIIKQIQSLANPIAAEQKMEMSAAGGQLKSVIDAYKEAIKGEGSARTANIKNQAAFYKATLDSVANARRDKIQKELNEGKISWMEAQAAHLKIEDEVTELTKKLTGPAGAAEAFANDPKLQDLYLKFLRAGREPIPTTTISPHYGVDQNGQPAWQMLPSFRGPSSMMGGQIPQGGNVSPVPPNQPSPFGRPGFPAPITPGATFPANARNFAEAQAVNASRDNASQVHDMAMSTARLFQSGQLGKISNMLGGSSMAEKLRQTDIDIPGLGTIPTSKMVGDVPDNLKTDARNLYRMMSKEWYEDLIARSGKVFNANEMALVKSFWPTPGMNPESKLRQALLVDVMFKAAIARHQMGLDPLKTTALDFSNVSTKVVDALMNKIKRGQPITDADLDPRVIFAEKFRQVQGLTGASPKAEPTKVRNLFSDVSDAAIDEAIRKKKAAK